MGSDAGLASVGCERFSPLGCAFGQPPKPEERLAPAQSCGKLATVSRDAVFARKRQNLLVAELNHRVKNVIALIRSICRQNREKESNLEVYANSLERRIEALSFAHQTAASEGGGYYADLRALIEQRVAPYWSGSNARLSGEPLGLNAEAAPLVALVVHELLVKPVALEAIRQAAPESASGFAGE